MIVVVMMLLVLKRAQRIILWHVWARFLSELAILLRLLMSTLRRIRPDMPLCGWLCCLAGTGLIFDHFLVILLLIYIAILIRNKHSLFCHLRLAFLLAFVHHRNGLFVGHLFSCGLDSVLSFLIDGVVKRVVVAAHHYVSGALATGYIIKPILIL